MRAVVFDHVGGPLELREIPEPDCPPDAAVIAVRATGICRSDWHAWRGHEPVVLPHVPGHEFAGVIARLGDAVTGFAVGERVTAPFVNGCGRCRWCGRGEAQVCPDQTQPGFTHAGSYAEQVVVRAATANLVRVPDLIDDVAAAALGCRFATAYRGLTAHGRVAAGDWVAVFGCGGVGLSAILIAVALGARVVAIDPSAAARARALDLGAVVALGADDPVAQVLEVTGGGAAVGLDALGSAETAYASVSCLARRGRHVQIGLMLGAHAGAALPWELVVARELQVFGSHGMAAADYPALLSLISSGRLDPYALVGRVIGLAEAGAALAAMDAPVASRAGTTVVRL